MSVKINPALNLAQTNASIERYYLQRTITSTKFFTMKSSLAKSLREEGPLLKKRESQQITNPFVVHKAAPSEKIAKNKKPFTGRISPFILLLAFLLVAAPYTIATHTAPIQNGWLAAFVFLFAMVNILFADFAIWNYFRGKKIFRIWVIELVLSVLIVHFLI